MDVTDECTIGLMSYALLATNIRLFTYLDVVILFFKGERLKMSLLMGVFYSFMVTIILYTYRLFVFYLSTNLQNSVLSIAKVSL